MFIAGWVTSIKEVIKKSIIYGGRIGAIKLMFYMWLLGTGKVEILASLTKF